MTSIQFVLFLGSLVLSGVCGWALALIRGKRNEKEHLQNLALRQAENARLQGEICGLQSEIGARHHERLRLEEQLEGFRCRAHQLETQNAVWEQKQLALAEKAHFQGAQRQLAPARSIGLREINPHL